MRWDPYLELHKGSWDVLSVEANFDPAWSNLCEGVLDRECEINSTAGTIQADGRVSQSFHACVKLTNFATKMHAEGEKRA
jgi:hypothetical protein